MKRENFADIAIVGAGIVGLAHAYMALKKGFRVVLFEREQFSIGASVRNFGMVWPIGQLPGDGLAFALRSRTHWIDVAAQAGLWINQNGSLHLAYHEDEMSVLSEFVQMYKDSGFETELLNNTATHQKSAIVNPQGLKGSLWSKTECTVNPPQAIRKIPLWLEDKWGLLLRFGHQVQAITLPLLETSLETWRVDQVIVCSGTDFQTLYPAAFLHRQITKCKLQMMKAEIPNGNLSVGPSLCAGLTLRHYQSFMKCPSLSKLDARYDSDSIFFKQHGIHVLLSQNNDGELIIGDSHEYNLTLEPFDDTRIDAIILDYLKTFINIPTLRITKRWHGIYAKLMDSNFWVEEIEPGVTIVNGLGGAGMTLSFGLAEKVINDI